MWRGNAGIDGVDGIGITVSSCIDRVCASPNPENGEGLKRTRDDYRAAAACPEYSVTSCCCSTARVGVNSQLNRRPANSTTASAAASQKPCAMSPVASLTAPMTSGATTADTQVKNRMTPAAAPCSAFGTQLMPF